MGRTTAHRNCFRSSHFGARHHSFPREKISGLQTTPASPSKVPRGGLRLEKSAPTPALLRGCLDTTRRDAGGPLTLRWDTSIRTSGRMKSGDCLTVGLPDHKTAGPRHGHDLMNPETLQAAATGQKNPTRPMSKKNRADLLRSYGHDEAPRLPWKGGSVQDKAATARSPFPIRYPKRTDAHRSLIGPTVGSSISTSRSASVGGESQLSVSHRPQRPLGNWSASRETSQ